MNPSNPATVDFWFDFASTYSYLSVMRIGDLARRSGITVRWRPFLLGPVLQHHGWSASVYLLHKEMATYMWRDLQRKCRKYGLPWQQPGNFPRRSVLPVRIATVGADEPWCEPFCQAVMTASFADDRDIEDGALLAKILTGLGLEADAILHQATSEANKLLLRQRTDEAADLGIFGAPSFIAGSELYWGDDRLEDALAAAGGQ